MGVLDLIVLIAHSLSTLPLAAVETPWVNAGMVAGYYASLLALGIAVHTRFRKQPSGVPAVATLPDPAPG
jgi:hypothetical protein